MAHIIVGVIIYFVFMLTLSILVIVCSMIYGRSRRRKSALREARLYLEESSE